MIIASQHSSGSTDTTIIKNNNTCYEGGLQCTCPVSRKGKEKPAFHILIYYYFQPVTTVVLFCLLVTLLKIEIDNTNEGSGLLAFFKTAYPAHTTDTNFTNTNTEKPQTNLLHLLTEVAATPPIVPINDTCVPKQLPR